MYLWGGGAKKRDEGSGYLRQALHGKEISLAPPPLNFLPMLHVFIMCDFGYTGLYSTPILLTVHLAAV